MSKQKKLTYRLKTDRRRRRVEIEAKPSYWAASPCATIDWPDKLMMRDELRVDISWSCGGTNFDVEKARAFFNAGLAICDRVEAILAKGKR